MRARLRLLWSMRRYLVSQSLALRRLPPKVARFYRRAWAGAVTRNEVAAFLAPASPEQLGVLLRLLGERTAVVELGTGAAWSAVALLLGAPRARVISYDPVAWPLRERYLALAPPAARARLELRRRPGESGPDPADPAVELLFVDSSHSEAETLASFEAWRGSLAPGALVVFHDYDNPQFPGVAAAIRRLGLSGSSERGMFVWRAGGSGS